jgi:hypothetical protein
MSILTYLRPPTVSTAKGEAMAAGVAAIDFAIGFFYQPLG